MSVHNKEYYQLTHPQRRIWFTDKINTNSQLHNIGGCVKIKGKIDINRMEKTLNIIIKNNDGLRLRFTEKHGEPIQYVKEFHYEGIDFLDFSKFETPKEQHEKWVKSLFENQFKLDDSKLYFFAIYKISENECGVVIQFHHGICDGWAITLIQNQICEIYSRLINNFEVSADECYSYLDFIKAEQEYLNSDKFIKNKNFWKEKLHDIPEEFLYNSSNSLDSKRMSFYINSDLSKKIQNFVKDEKCSLNTFFIAISLLYINKSIHKNDLVIGTPVFNRSSKAQKSMVGMFTSTMPFRFKLNTELNIGNLIKQINRELKLCFINQKYPYDLLVKDLEINKDGYDSLFKMSVNYYNSKYKNDINGTIKVESKEYHSGNQSHSLQLVVQELEDENIELNFDYKTLEYTDNQIKTMYQYMTNIINQVLKDEELTINNIKLINEEERIHKVFNLNSTANQYPKKTVCELFEEQAKKTPDKVAVEFKEKTLTYRELNEKANQLSDFLREKGLSKQSNVAIMQTHSIDLLISILGVLKTGAVYLPIDPSYPIERINYMLEDSNSKMLLTNLEVDTNIKCQGTIINIRDIDLSFYNKEILTNVNDLNDLVYIIYTSGSTGKPKGVMVKHQGLTNYICWADKRYLKGEDESMALYSSISFDLTVTSIFTPLISGNRIIIYENDETEFVLYKILRENKSTVVKLTPAHLTLLKDRDNRNSNIKRFIVGGEDLKVNLAKEVHKSFGKSIEIFNEYGPTETVVGCMTYKYDEEIDKGVSVPIGYPADNVQIYILDQQLNIVPTGFVGEIYASGDGVAKGYLNREELTSERFVENPFVNKRKKMYKTGDMARYLENGVIEYIGRIDNQIKIRGHRVEISEIEKYLLENEFIKDAVVVYKENPSENLLLNAYIVNKKEINDFELKEWLLQFLPNYMIPTNFIFIDKIPLTVNGKVNYHLLPEPIIMEQEFVEYSTSAEKELVKAIEEILSVENISMNDNYYQLGGDSIKAIQISSKLKNKGLEIKIKDILDHDTIEEIAATIEESKELKSINQEQAQGVVERTPIMEWFFNQDFENQHLYNQHVLLEYTGVLDIDLVRVAVNRLIGHHDGLRMNYDKKDHRLFYNNEYINENFLVEYFDLSQYSYEGQYEKINHINDWVNAHLNIENGLLFHVTMFHLGGERQVLLFTAHHLIVDGISWRIILDDFLTILKQLNDKKEVKLPMKTHSFKTWAEALQEYSKKDFDTEKAYWQQISNRDFTYLVDDDREEDTVGTANVLYKELDEDTLNNLIKKVNEIYNLELNETLIIALVITLNDLTNRSDIVIELERHGREFVNDYIDVSRTIGWFTSMFPAYFVVDHEDINNNIKSLKEQLRNIPNKGFNYSILKFLNNELRDKGNKHIRFNYLGDFDTIFDREGLNFSNIKFGLDSDKKNSLTSLMDIDAIVVNKKLKISFTYSRNRFEDETIKKLMDSYVDTLKLILDKCTNEDLKEFTPSDFDAAGISQEELDSLFD
ncbi:amino acid adenylation domain-containing protein [Peribacillus sp. N1]